MKYFAVLFLTLLITSPAFSYWEVKFTKECPGQGYRAWTGNPYNPCPPGGYDCRSEITWKDEEPCHLVATSAPNGGWILTSGADAIQAVSFLNTNTLNTATGSVTGFAFLQHEYSLEILSAESNTEYISVTLDMANATVNSDGSFTIYVPPVQ
ncbi:MAG: hypothetical protein U0Y96_14195 [Candidatus Kapaibacterium sp.]|nr:hypothetical protein [Bacteroidota bacterium]